VTGRLSRYVMRAVIQGALLVLAVLLALDTVFTLFGEMDHIGHGDYDLTAAIVYVLLRLPARVYDLFPTAIAIGGVLGLGTLAANSELIVMRAAGISIRRIIGMVMQGGLVLMLAIVLVGEGVAPEAQQAAERMRGAALAGQGSVQGEHGLWVRDGQRFINVGTVLPGYVLRNVRVYEFHDRRLERAVRADRAVYQHGEWRLSDIDSTVFDNGGTSGEDGKLRTVHEDSAVWQRLVRPELFQLLAVSPESLPIWRLYDYVEYLRSNRLDSARFELAFWHKIATPLSTLVMLLLALPVIFGSLRSAGTGQRIFFGSVIGLGYYLVSELFAHIGIVYGLAAPVAALAPAVLFAVVGAFSLRRIV